MIELWDRVLLVISPRIKTSFLQVDQDQQINIKDICHRDVKGGTFDARFDPLQILPKEYNVLFQTLILA